MKSPVVVEHQPTIEHNAYDLEFWLTYFANTCLIVSISSLFRYYDFVAYLGGDEYDLGLIFGLGMIGGLIARFAQGALIDRLGPRVIWLSSLALMILSLIGHFLITNVDGPFIYLLRLVFNIGLAGAFGATLTSVSLRAPSGRSTELIGVLGSSGFIGLAIGPILGDLIFSNSLQLNEQIAVMFGLSIGAAGLSMIGAYLATRGNLPQKSRDMPSLGRLDRKSVV